ncbi:hypothetical protein [Mycoplasma ovis]|uniref:hypothetical protein n=1 Tax=Mycoplasma ovis TaxID=171632 RepID=UPI00118257E8|nr:hypothetical protein [Mycoplasma ovis]
MLNAFWESQQLPRPWKLSAKMNYFCTPLNAPPKKKNLINKFNQICNPIFELQKNNEQIITKCLRLQKCIVETLD